MTQIQALENMSQPEVVALYQELLQRYEDDMNMLSKELASRAAPVDPYRALMADQAELINIERLQRWLTKYGISTPESLEELGAKRGHYVNALTRQEPFGSAAPTAPVAAQAQWIEHCNITDIPDAVLTPTGLAIKSEQADTQEPVAAREPLPPLNDDLIAILGRPNFMCAGIAQALRDSGHEIKKRAENEQAAALHFLLGHYLSDPQNWDWKAAIALNPDKTTCTCPSGNGSLRWPCPVHPPEE